MLFFYLLLSILIILQIVILLRKSKSSDLDFDFEPFDDRYETLRGSLVSSLGDKGLKKSLKALKKERGQLKKNLYLIDFDGDTKASASKQLSDVINVLIPVLQKSDTVVCHIKSGGGMVPHYGHAASQLSRLREHCHLVASIDIVAASGGYMMASVAHTIIAAPFSIVGSIGVVAQMPNFNKFLKSKDIEFEEHTAGESKRSLTLFGENTDQKREKFVEKLEVTHDLFKKHIQHYRPEIDIDKVSTGDYFYANESVTLLDNKLVDEIQTLDDYISTKKNDHRVWRVNFEEKKTLMQKFFSLLTQLIHEVRFL